MAKSSSSSKSAPVSSGRAALNAIAGATQGASTPVSSPSTAKNQAAITFGSSLANSIKTDPVYSKPFNISGSSYSGGSSAPSLNFSSSRDFSPTVSAPSTYSPSPTKSSTGGSSSTFNISRMTNPGTLGSSRLNFNMAPSSGKTSLQIAEERKRKKAQQDALTVSLDNNKTNQMVAGGKLPQSQAELIAQKPAIPKVPMTSEQLISNFPWNIEKARAGMTQAQIDALSNAGAPKLDFSAVSDFGNTTPVVPKVPKPEIPVPEIPNPGDISSDNIDSQISALQQEYLNSLLPTPEEQTTQTQLDQELAALQQGLVNVEDQPVALPFITGQSAALERRSSARTTPLSQALARIQSMRTAKGSLANARLGFANSALDREAKIQEAKTAKEEKDFANKVLLATKGLRYDPATDTFSSDPSLAGAMDPKDRANLEEGLRNKYLEQSKDYQTVRNYYQRMLAVSKDPSAAGDIALLFSYMKVLDPTSVVREGEFATAQNAASVPDAIRNLWNKVLNGEKLTANRQDFITQGTNIYNSSKAQQDQLTSEFQRIAKANGVLPDNVIVNLGATQKYSGAPIDNSLGSAIPSSTGVQPDAIKDLDADILGGYSIQEIQGAYPGISSQQIIARKQELANQSQEALRAYMAELGM